jgi:hypothetical protein
MIQAIRRQDNSSCLSKCRVHRKGNGDTGEDHFLRRVSSQLLLKMRSERLTRKNPHKTDSMQLKGWLSEMHVKIHGSKRELNV